MSVHGYMRALGGRHASVQHNTAGWVQRCSGRAVGNALLREEALVLDVRLRDVLELEHLVRHAVVTHGVEELLVAALAHRFDLLVRPSVHGNRPDEAEVHPEATMQAGALEAEQGTVCDTGPLGVHGRAVPILAPT